MPVFSSISDIKKAIRLFNKHTYNAGFEFKVYTSDKYCLYVQGSFDFGYYVNVDIEFRDVVFTNILPNASWPDAWHADQLFLLDEDEWQGLLAFNEIEWNSHLTYFGFVFNIIGRDNYSINGTVICSSLYLNWRYPNRNEQYDL